ncbi:hypothetical protein [Pseudarthrobacter sp. BIM B-2242]|uniref:hypothetical protein n=1 Tax=Pseudarthrobacter sp. BIM B-2242 TaxID=2772401 RepID=UPI00168B20CB|nr:hypothetical protein [Pseudarthrobacter sp. BIM B-2242]QOD05945.1 hypothetical protein IDT60_20465 [Pseudarthrobacter sp. BIM B-2242]
MGFVLGVLAIGLLWLICVIGVVVGAVWLVAPKRPKAPTPPRPKPALKPAPAVIAPPRPEPAPKTVPASSTPAPQAAPMYVPRWGPHRRAWEVRSKAQWQAEFDQDGE